jgi:hypothetical protein
MLNVLAVLALIAAPAATGTAPAKPAPKREVAERSADKYDKVICKKFVETGSLVRGYRECKTKWEWERERDAINTKMNGGACNDMSNNACSPNASPSFYGAVSPIG